MLARSASRQPAPVLAFGAMWSGLHDRPNAFGNALGSALSEAATSGSQQNPAQANSDAQQQAFRRSEIADMNVGVGGFPTDGGGSYTGGQAWAADVGARRAATLTAGSNPYSDYVDDGAIVDPGQRLMNRVNTGLYNNLTSTPQAPLGYREGPYQPIEPGIYNYREWTDDRGLNKTWNDYPTNVSLKDSSGQYILPKANIVLEPGGSSGIAQSNGSDSTIPYHMAPGFITTSYQQGVSMMKNSNLSATERIIGGTAASLMAPMMLLEEAGRGLINAPGQLYSAAVNAARVYTAPTVEGKVVAGLTAVRDGATGLLGLAPLVPAKMMMPTPVLTAQEMAVAQFPGAQATAAARATYVSDGSAAVESAAVNATQRGTFIFRGDARSPEVVFEQGFQPRGTNQDLFRYAVENEPSVYVPTSTSPTVAREFAEMQGGGYVYTVRGQPQGVDVNAVLGSRSPFPSELEIAVPGGIRPTDIMGARQVAPNGKFLGSFIKNGEFGW